MKKDWSYVAGDWWAICDVCGQKHKAQSMKHRWDGLMVCPTDFEQRHSQDFIKAKIDKIVVPWTRPRPSDAFILPLGLVDNVKLYDAKGQDYIDPDYFAEDYLTSGFSITLLINRTFNDTVTTTDQVNFNISTNLADTFTTTDTVTPQLIINESLNDSFIVSDTGYVFVNSYIDSSYFAEDYVGTTSTF